MGTFKIFELKNLKAIVIIQTIKTQIIQKQLLS